LKLIPVKEFPWAAQVLYELLKVRAPEENISHRVMPSYEEHINFFESNPYDAWYLIEKEFCTEYFGAIYINRGEIGIHLFPQHRNKGYEIIAIRMLFAKCALERYFINVAVDNRALADAAKYLGGKMIQVTYEIKNERA